METLPQLLTFAIAASVTPGPNTLMVTAMAARGGARSALPAVLGITLGFTVMLVIVAVGLAAPLAASPALQSAMKTLGAVWLLWLAWKIAAAPAPGEGPDRPPMGFWGAAAFQWVNPKAWLVGLAAIAAFSTGSDGVLASGMRVALAFGVVSLPCLMVWVALGLGARRLLRTARSWRLFNMAMGILLASSILPILV